jgi:hypothetical protein
MNIHRKNIKQALNLLFEMINVAGTINGIEIYLNVIETDSLAYTINSYIVFFFATLITLLNIIATHPRFTHPSSRFFLAARYLKRIIDILGLHNFILLLQLNIATASCSSIYKLEGGVQDCQANNEPEASALCCLNPTSNQVYINNTIFGTLITTSLCLAALDQPNIRIPLKLLVEDGLRFVNKKILGKYILTHREPGWDNKMYHAIFGTIGRVSLTHAAVMLIEKILEAITGNDVITSTWGKSIRYSLDSISLLYNIIAMWRNPPSVSMHDGHWYENNWPTLSQITISTLLASNIVENISGNDSPHNILLGCLFSTLTLANLLSPAFTRTLNNHTSDEIKNELRPLLSSPDTQIVTNNSNTLFATPTPQESNSSKVKCMRRCGCVLV